MCCACVRACVRTCACVLVLGCACARKKEGGVGVEPESKMVSSARKAARRISTALSKVQNCPLTDVATSLIYYLPNKGVRRRLGNRGCPEGSGGDRGKAFDTGDAHVLQMSLQ